MAKFGRLAIGLLLASGSWSCVLYTDSINQGPKVKLTGDTTINFGDKARYHATITDPDQSPESVSIEWRRWVGGCPLEFADANTGDPVARSGADFVNDMDFAEEFCVWAVVRDKDGAYDYSYLQTQVTHKMAVTALDVVKPTPNEMDRYPLFSAVRLSAAKSVDPEKGTLTFGWLITRNGSPINHLPCTEAPQTDVCFDADQPGSYVVTLTVTDARGVAVPKERKLTINPDAFPCIRRTDPDLPDMLTRVVRDATDPISFAIKHVEDDGDPLPMLPGKTSSLSFIATWWRDGDDPNDPVRRPALFEVDPVAMFKPGYFRNGERAFVRIQVNDRVPRDFGACQRANVANCALNKDDQTCFQWVTWTVDFLPDGM